MPHSYNKVWVHLIFSTKDWVPLISNYIELKVHDHLREQFISIGCPVRIINGMPDHIHALFLLNPKMAIIDVIKQIKGNTSHWINEQNLINDKFSWQAGYAAYSVSESQRVKVYLYIKNQKEHHTRKTFMQEYEAFIKVHGLVIEHEEVNG